MENEELSDIRYRLKKSQKQMSQLLGISLKAIQSYEQGWRKIPVHVERQVLFLLASKESTQKKGGACWVIRKCPMEVRKNCPAWELQIGHLCWFINGTVCQGQVEKGWQQKMRSCRQCEVFKAQCPL